ncbi:M23 family metallopeptidase [Dactylosporangium sp. AC04546]|uniref:M23 family metallopeptidase n=1 Tax=Dactylosporangium sp. AC04546 TaxID=2862460 RepID=UPI001EE10B57|nr:M23 family metallopeptidase [Dactylosporangium sp. AC04546]WVK80955.1 M23 family metallopeptidase [Dactylosporangium sp. AC04546]
MRRLAVAAVLMTASVAAVQFTLAGPAQAAGWVRPLANYTTNGGYTGPQPGHNGVDIIAPANTDIRAASGGVVEQAQWDNGCGWYVGIRHSTNEGTLYCHMISQPLVSVGQSVSTGQVIGRVGSTGNSGTPHLHFQTHVGTSLTEYNTTDPMAFMLARGVNLASGNPPPTNPPPSGGPYNVTTFANAPGYASATSTTQTGTLNAGTNYVYCKYWGRNVGNSTSYNHWWLKTDLDSGSPWQNQYVSAYYLSNWGNDEALTDAGVTIPTCSGGAKPVQQYWVTTYGDAPGFSSAWSTTLSGWLYGGSNYVYCKVWGREIRSGSSFNHWWLKTDLDSGSSWQNQYVSAYFLSNWGNDEGFADNGVSIPSC